MEHADDFDINPTGATVGGYECGCVVAVQSKVFLPGSAGAVKVASVNDTSQLVMPIRLIAQHVKSLSPAHSVDTKPAEC